ncbi:MAG TPA: TetR/AcrR family transcriptional regulator [Geothermobacteraceae bacterium]|nr:TetR/AcrR family transcriptional regulator [Geothermobacteraceae bacterium]
MAKPDKRDEIIRAALEMIAEQGFHGSPMAELAKRAGVGAGTIYRYFENKEVLIAELYRELEERVYPVLLEGYSTERPVRERFLQLGSALLRYFIEHPLDFRYLEQFHNSPYGVECRRAKLFGENGKQDVCRELFLDGIAAGEFKELPLPVLFALAFGPLLAVTRDHILGFVALDEGLIARTVEACWDAVRSQALDQ